MAATDARPVPKKGVAYRHYFAIRKNDGTLITTWAGQDSEVSKDAAGFADCTNEATEDGTSGCGYIDLTSAEMNADHVHLKVTVTNTDALPYVVSLFPEEAGDIRADATMLVGSTQSATDLKDFADTGYDPSTHKVAGVVLTDTCTTNTDMRGTDNALTTLGTNAPAGWINATAIAASALDDKGNWTVTGDLAGLSTHSAADVATALGTGSTLTALASAASITALRGADSDTLKTVSDQIDGISAEAGGGGIAYEVACTYGGNPLDGVKVWVTTDTAGSNVVASGYTGVLGTVTFMLEAGTYYLWKQLAGYNAATNPETITVS